MRNQHLARRLLRRLLGPAVLAFSLLGSSPSDAQPRQPVIKFVFPQGGQRGQTMEATVSGTDLQGANAVRVTGAGVTANVVKVENPATVRISVAIAQDAEVGERDIRVITPAGGASSRFRFFVGDLPEINEKEPNSLESQAQPLESLPIRVNGQILSSDRDIFRLTAKAGQTLVFEVQARKLLPYIADAVPGWLEACLTLYDGDGKELKSVDNFRFNPDPVLIHNVQKDGEYLIEVRDIIYRGRADFVYRLTVGLSPYITHIFPLGWQRNSDAHVELHGVNLPTQRLTFKIPADDPPLHFVRVNQNGMTSNTLPFAVGDTGESREAEPNDSIQQANRVAVPVAVNGRIQRSGDADYFRFGAKKGERLIVEVQARRLDSPLDSIITLFNSQGGELREQDDTDMGDPLLTHHADSRLDYTFPSDGDYVVRIRDIQAKGGEEYAYRLHIAAPRPDFTLRTIPDNPRAGQSDTAMVTVKALRKDGFNGEITVAVQNLPAGFVTSPAVIPAGQSQMRLTITAPPDAAVALLAPTIVGTATIGEQAVSRKAVGAEDIMQAFSLRHDVPTKEFLVAVIESAFFTLSTDIPTTEVRDVRQESQIPVVVKASRKGLKAAVEQAEAEKKAADETLAKVKEDLAKAKTGYAAAEKAAKEAEAAAASAKTAATNAAAKQANAEKAAAAKRQQAVAAKKKRDDLVAQRQKPAEAKVAVATKAVTEATTAKAASDKTLAGAKAAMDPSQQALQAAEKAAREAEAAAKTIAEDAGKSAEEKKKAADEAAAKRKAAGAAKTALTQAQKNHRQAQTQVQAAVKKLAEGESQKKAAEQALANVKNQVAAATQAHDAAEKAAKRAETAAATAKVEADKARATQVAAEKAAPEKRKLAGEAKARQDQLTNDEKAANTRSAAVKKSTDAINAKAKLDIKLTADALPRGVTFKPASIPADKSEVTVTLAVTNQAAVGLRQNIVITGTVGSGNDTTVHVAPALPIKVLVSVAALTKAAATKRQQANDAKKKLDDLVQKQQKPAEAKLAAAAKAVSDATTAKAATDKALAEAKAATATAQQADQASEKAAKEAEAAGKAIAEDAAKSEEEKKKAADEAAAKRKAAGQAKTAVTQAQKKEQKTQSQANTAVKKLAEAEARKKAAEQALANVKNQVAAATGVYQAADKAAKEAETEAAKAKA
ncbi:MAG: hypothetical protein ACC628_09720 [Pirellulaceae bacterium]